MSIIDKMPGGRALLTRIKNILFTPEAEWEVIEAETATIRGLYTRYACILAAIGPIAQFFGSQIFGYRALWVSYRPPLTTSLATAVVSYVFALAGVFIMATIINALAPSFGGQSNRIQAFKVAVYSATAFWIVGIFALLPPVRALGIIGIYSLYLLYLGVPKLMKAPKDKALIYTLVVVVVAIVVSMAVTLLSGAAAGLTGFAGVSSAGSLTVG
jgi:hypothetical protein